MRKRNVIVAVLLAACTACACAQSQPIAVVVSPRNSMTNISMASLREVFQCERTTWSSGERIAAFSRSGDTPEHETMLRAIFRMKESDYKQFWVVKQMRGEGSCKVTELPSKGMTAEALRAYPGGIALVRLSDVTPGMKVITVNGKKPDDPEYPLQ